MISSKMIIAASILIATAAISLAFGLEQYWVGSVAALGLGFWGWYGWVKMVNAWSTDLYFGGTVLLVMAGGFFGLKIYFLLITLIGSLAAWDLIRFQRRIEHSPSSESIPGIEKRHLTILGLAILGGGIFASVMVTARLQISFYAALVLGVILVISMGEIIRFVKN